MTAQLPPSRILLVEDHADSGNNGHEDIERAKAAGFDAYMLKPIEIGRFFGLLEQLCRYERAPRALAREFITVLTCATEGTGEAAQN